MPESTPKNQSVTDRETPDEVVPEASATAPEKQREPLLGLSITQVVGSSAAAATAAALGSRLGLVGTVVGAALISVVTAVAGAVYSRSLQRTREAMARTAEKLPTVRIPVQRPHGQSAGASVTEPDGSAAGQHRWRRVRWKPVAVTAVVVFLLAGGIVTGIEALTGRSFNGDGRTSVGELIGRDSTPSRSVQDPSGGASPSDQGTTGSDGDGSAGSSDGSDSDDEQGSGTPATERPTPTPTPTAEPSDGSTGSGSTTPTPQPSSTPTASSTPTTGGTG